MGSRKGVMGNREVMGGWMGYGRCYDGQEECYRIRERSEAGPGQSYRMGNMRYVAKSWLPMH